MSVSTEARAALAGIARRGTAAVSPAAPLPNRSAAQRGRQRGRLLAWTLLPALPLLVCWAAAWTANVDAWVAVPATAAAVALAWALSGRLARSLEKQAEARAAAEAAAEGLREELSFTRAMTHDLGEGICAVDRQGRLILMNPAAERMLGWQAHELLGRDLHAAIHAGCCPNGGAAAPSCPLGSLMQRGQRLHSEDDLFARRDGTRLSVAHTASPIVQDGRTRGAVLAFHDISMRKRVEAALRETSRMKDEFVSVVSHELRTPLTTMMGYAEILLQQRHGALTERQVRQVRGVREAAQRQLILIENMLDISRLEGGAIELTLEPVRPHDAMRQAVEAMQSVAASRSIELAAPPGNVPHVLADAKRLQQILHNLLSNAIKFSTAGDTVTLTAHLASGPVPAVEFSVRDTGIGIAPAHLAHVWDRFYQVDSSSTRRFEGAGLGLAIVKRLVELHGGRASAVSQGLGLGSTFGFTLPVATAPARGVLAPRALLPRAPGAGEPPRERLLEL